MGYGISGGFPNTRGCFVAGTIILTQQGYQPIEDIKTGDFVYSKNILSREKRLKQVINTFQSVRSTLISISFDGCTIETTEDHPFWVNSTGWTLAGDLSLENQLLLNSEIPINIIRIEKRIFDISITVYNLEVDEWSTYYVSELEVLVHNKAQGPYKQPKRGSGKEKASDVPRWARGFRPLKGQSGKEFAKELMDDKYGKGNYKTGPGTEFNQIQKWGDRGFE